MMGNILNTKDVVNSIKKIEKDCEQGTGYGQPYGKPGMDYEKFYERVKGLMSLLEENSENKKGSSISA